jgi:hypothetical protein
MLTGLALGVSMVMPPTLVRVGDEVNETDLFIRNPVKTPAAPAPARLKIGLRAEARFGIHGWYPRSLTAHHHLGPLAGKPR